MNIHNIDDVYISDLKKIKFDIGIFSSGYEKRSIDAIKIFDENNFNNLLIFGFKEHEINPTRIENNEYYIQNWDANWYSISSTDDKEIYDILNNQKYNSETTVKILVDYSSMSRNWYTSIINWAKYNNQVTNLELYFIYSIGEHYSDYDQKYIKKISTLPGFEGGTVSLARSLAIFGLGFDGDTSLCVIDHFEPDLVYTFMASPGAFDDYAERTKEYNKDLLEISKLNLELPLRSVRATFIKLSELIQSQISYCDISLIPMGPKPHVLAATLVSLKFEDIICLHVERGAKIPENVGSTKEYVCTKIQFQADEQYGYNSNKTC